MLDCELIADGTSLDLQSEVAVSINLSIAEIQDITKRQGDFSKTVKLPGTKANNKFFEQTYDVNIKTASFNPNIKVPAFFRQSGDKPLKGDLRLLNIEVIDLNGIEKIVYDVTILGRNDTLITAMGESKLEDLDLSTYNHPFTYAKQNACESNTCDVATVPTVCANGVGYRYPVIDYGYNGFNSNYYHVNHLRPAFFKKTYWDAIFAAAGKTYTSVFLNDVNDLFCRDLLLHNGERLTVSAATQALYEFYAGMTATSASKNFPMYYTNTNNWSTIKSTPTTLLFNNVTNASLMCVYDDDTTLPFIDTGTIYDDTTGIWTVANTANYQILGSVIAEIKLNLPAGATTSTNGTCAYACKVAISTDSGVTWTMDYYDFFNDSTVLTTSYQTISHNLAIPNKVYNAGDMIRIEFHPLVNWSASGVNFLNGATPVTSGTPSLDWKLKSTSVVNFKLVSPEIQEGSNLVANDAIPKDIKQRDFVLHCIKKYNLYVDVDKDNPNNYLIEPRNEFYAAGGERDWTKKWAVNMPRTIVPMGAIDWKNLILTYKPDQDYYNKPYFDSYQEAYGTHKETLVNDFLTRDLKNELIFSPTPVVNNPYNDLIIPKIFSFDGTTVKPMKHNIRTVLWRGSVSMTNSWTYGSTSGNVTKTSYQGCAMSDNPLAATETIEFGVPNELYYSGIGSTYTTNNLFNRFYSQQISQIIHRDSKLVTMFMKLEPSDIATFDFRDKIWVKDSWYYVNKIMDYNPVKEDLCKVEFLKIVSGDTYTPIINIDPNTMSTNRGYVGIKSLPFGNTVISSNTMASNRIAVGSNNSSGSEGGLMSGDGNRIGNNCVNSDIIGSTDSHIGENCTNVKLINCVNCKVGDYASDITLVNCTNYTIDEGVESFMASYLSDETIFVADNETIRNGNEFGNTKIKSQTKTADFDVDKEVSLYYVDCTGGNITAMFTFANSADRTITFIRTDASANSFSIDEVSGTATLEGSGVPVNLGMVQYESIPINNNGVNFFIV